MILLSHTSFFISHTNAQALASLSRIGKTNELTRAGEAAFKRGAYALAARDYGEMISKYGVESDEVLANLGHSQFRAGNMAEAARAYTRLAASKEPSMRSLANTNLGAIAARQNNFEEAANRMRQALRDDPNNELARINYERLLRRKPQLQPPPPKQQNQKQKEQQEQQKQQQKEKEEKEKQQGGQGEKKTGKQDKKSQGQKPGEKPENQPDKDKEGNDGKDSQQNREGAKGKKGEVEKPEGEKEEGQPNTNEKDKAKEDTAGEAATREQLKKMQIPEDKARQILEAMRASEVQYIQQRRYRQKNQSNGLPNW